MHGILSIRDSDRLTLISAKSQPGCVIRTESIPLGLVFMVLDFASTKNHYSARLLPRNWLTCTLYPTEQLIMYIFFVYGALIRSYLRTFENSKY